jgi:hypothetical protein
MSSGIHIGILFIGCPAFIPHCSIFSITLAKKELVPKGHVCKAGQNKQIHQCEEALGDWRHTRSCLLDTHMPALLVPPHVA